MAYENRRKLHLSLVIVGFIFGILFMSISIWAGNNVEKIMERVISSKAVIKEGSETFKNWENSSVEIFFKVYVYNLTNAEKVLSGEDPHYKEIGPYIYIEKRIKEFYQFGQNGEDLKYLERRYFYFDKAQSRNDPHSDMVTQINLSLNTVCHNPMGIAEKIALRFLNENLFKTMPVHDYLWGYLDPLIELSGKGNQSGIFLGMNGTLGDPTTINTGLYDISLIGSIIESNGKSEMDAWTTYEANMINGTDGSMFSPGLSRDNPVYVFASDVCRSFKLIFSKSVRADNDDRIELLEYIGDPKQSLNATVNPDNLGFCVKDPIGPKCPLAGLMDLSKCRGQDSIRVPLYASQPRFYQTDPQVTQRLKGIIPPSDDVQTILQIHQPTGLPLQVAKRLQMNMYVKPNPDFEKFYKSMSGEYYLPLTWIEESAKANSDILQMIYNRVNGGRDKLLTAVYIILSFSVFAIVTSLAFTIYLFCFNKRKYYNEDEMMNSDDGQHLFQQNDQ